MFSIYLVNNDLNNTGFEQNVQIPVMQENQQTPVSQNYLPGAAETLPELPKAAETTVSDRNYSDTSSAVNMPFISILIIILFILIVFILKNIRNSNRNNQYSAKQTDNTQGISETGEPDIKINNKSFATPENIKKGVKLFLENTRIR